MIFIVYVQPVIKRIKLRTQKKCNGLRYSVRSENGLKHYATASLLNPKALWQPWVGLEASSLGKSSDKSHNIISLARINCPSEIN